MGVKIDGYTYNKSTHKDKKLMVEVDGKIIHFGDRNMEHYRDKTGFYKNLDHNDEQRRKSYIARASGIKNKEGKLTKDDPSSPNYHAIRILW